MSREIPNPSITPPDWSIQPKEIAEIVKEDGRPTFEFLHIPENGFWRLSQIAFTVSENPFTLTPEIAARKEAAINRKKEELKANYLKVYNKWEAGGRQGEPPPYPSFFDGKLVRLLPNDVYTTTNPKREQIVVLPEGETSYFDYVATRDLDQKKYPQEQMAMPLTMCGVLIAENRDGQKYMIYTVRTTKPESYQRFFHVVGGMLAKPRWDMANPTGAWIKELGEEAGIDQNDIETDGSLGLVKDTYWPHAEVTHKARLVIPMEEVFTQNGVNLKPANTTDKEVELRAIMWKPELVRALILGEKVASGDQDLRPWVPTGLANLLLAGRIDFGQEWFNKTLKAYREKISLLRK